MKKIFTTIALFMFVSAVPVGLLAAGDAAASTPTNTVAAAAPAAPALKDPNVEQRLADLEA